MCDVQGRCSYLFVKSDRCSLDVEIQQMRIKLDHHMAMLHRVTNQCLRIKDKSVRDDSRALVVSHITAAASAAGHGRMKDVYANLRRLQPWAARPLPMLKLADGSFAQSPQAIAARWLAHFSGILGGGGLALLPLTSVRRLCLRVIESCWDCLATTLSR